MPGRLTLAPVIAVLPVAAWAQPREESPGQGRWGPRPYPIEVATAVAVCMGESDSASGPFGVSGGITGAYITADNQPIVHVTRGKVDPELTPWFHQVPNDSLALVMLHAGRRTHLAATACYEERFSTR